MNGGLYFAAKTLFHFRKHRASDLALKFFNPLPADNGTVGMDGRQKLNRYFFAGFEYPAGFLLASFADAPVVPMIIWGGKNIKKKNGLF